MKFKLEDITRIRLILVLNDKPKLNTIRTKLLNSKEIELTDEEVSELILLGLKLND